MDKLIKASGRISVDEKRGRVALEVGGGIIDYYNWFITNRLWVKLQRPLYGGHITLVSPNFHKKIDWKYANSLKGKRFSYYYDPFLMRGGKRKGFLMFYLKVHSVDLELIKKRLGVVEPSTYQGLHLTISNGKGGITPSWPQMIEVSS